MALLARRFGTKVRVAPGEAAGSADVDIEIEAGEPCSAYAIVDNHGSRHTAKGVYRCRSTHYNARSFDGGIAQLGERLHGMQEVSGSIPLTSTR